MTQRQPFGLSPDYHSQLQLILAKYKRVVIFGSRARGDFGANSDIDMCIFDEISFDEYLGILVKIDDLEMPYKIDLVRFDKISSPELRANILIDGIDIATVFEI